MQHSLETFGLATAPPEPLKTQIFPPFLSPPGGYTLRVRGPGGPGPHASVPLAAQSAQLTAAALGAGWEAVLGASHAGKQQNRKRPAPGGGERKEGRAQATGARQRARAGDARGAVPQSRPVAASPLWLSVWSPTSISGRTCSRGCGRSGRRQRALGPEVAAQVLAARVKGGGKRVGAGEAGSLSHSYLGASQAGLRWWAATRPVGGSLCAPPTCEG